MKKVLSMLLTFVMVLSVVAAVPVDTLQAATVSISEKSRMIAVKDQFRLYLKNCGTKVTWSSKNTSVAKVSSKGIVTGIGEGKTTILAKAGKAVYKCNVQVIKGLSPVYSEIAKRIGNDLLRDYKENVATEDSVHFLKIEKGLYQESSAGDGISSPQSADYKIYGIVTSKKGEKVPYIWLYNSEKSSSGATFAGINELESGWNCHTDTAVPQEIVSEIENRVQLIVNQKYDPEEDGKIKLSRDKVTLCMGETYQFSIKNTSNGKNKVTWKSSNSSIASVTGGKIKAKKTGTVKITAIADGTRVSASVYVIPKYSKDVKNVIRFVSGVRRNLAYPDEMKITDIQVGTFLDKSNQKFFKNAKHFAMVFFTTKDNNGNPYQGYIDVFSYQTVAGKTSMMSAFYEGESYSDAFTPQGQVKHCSKKELKEINELIRSGKGTYIPD